MIKKSSKIHWLVIYKTCLGVIILEFISLKWANIMIQKKCRGKLHRFWLNKAVVLLRKYLNSGTLSCYRDDLDIYEDSKSDNRSSIWEEQIGVEEEDSEFILSANEYLSLDTKVSAGAELARTFVLEDCVIFLLNVVKCACFLVGLS